MPTRLIEAWPPESPKGFLLNKIVTGHTLDDQAEPC